MTKVKHIPIADIKPDLMNANRHTERGTYQLKNSIEKFGFAEAGTLDANNRIIAGNNRTEVAVDVLDSESVRVIEHDGKTPIYIKLPHIDLETVEGRELAVALNRTAQVGIEFDPDMLRQLDDMGVELGDWFTDLELDDMGIDIDEPEPAEDAGADVDRASELQEQWGTETGQLWVLPSRDGKGVHRLLIGDCTVKENVERLMGGEKPRISSFDPPYGIGLDKSGQTIGLSKSYGAVIGDADKTTAVMMYEKWGNFGEVNVWWGANHYGGHILRDSPCWLVWDKDHHGMTFADAEIAWTDAKMPIRCFRHAWSGNHRSSEVGQKRFHINQKPIALFEWYFEKMSSREDLVFDGCCGVGGSLIACENLNRYCRAMELSPAYCAVILQRYTDTFGVSPYLSS